MLKKLRKKGKLFLNFYRFGLRYCLRIRQDTFQPCKSVRQSKLLDPYYTSYLNKIKQHKGPVYKKVDRESEHYKCKRKNRGIEGKIK